MLTWSRRTLSTIAVRRRRCMAAPQTRPDALRVIRVARVTDLSYGHRGHAESGLLATRCAGNADNTLPQETGHTGDNANVISESTPAPMRGSSWRIVLSSNTRDLPSCETRCLTAT